MYLMYQLIYFIGDSCVYIRQIQNANLKDVRKTMSWRLLKQSQQWKGQKMCEVCSKLTIKTPKRRLHTFF